MSRNRPFTVCLIGLTLLAAGAGCAGPNRRMNFNFPRLDQVGPMLGMGKAKAEAPTDPEPAEGTWAMAAREAGPIPGQADARLARRSRSADARRASEAEAPRLTRTSRHNDERRGDAHRHREAVQPPVDFTDAPTIRPALGAIERDRDDRNEPAPDPSDRAQTQQPGTDNDNQARVLPTLSVGLTLETPQAPERRLDPETRPASRRAALPEALPEPSPRNQLGRKPGDSPSARKPNPTHRAASDSTAEPTLSPFPEPRRPRPRLFQRAELLRRLFSRPAASADRGSNERAGQRFSQTQGDARAGTLEARANSKSDWLLPDV